jgi:hypothetical protein
VVLEERKQGGEGRLRVLLGKEVAARNTGSPDVGGPVAPNLQNVLGARRNARFAPQREKRYRNLPSRLAVGTVVVVVDGLAGPVVVAGGVDMFGVA